ncbi:MAG: hypothetical protein CM15mP103_08240 [Gammaproteobacteria bacterium]|nr:MAG: hypothetical protein CM15mP103_08240 [Gammaproteobacteria bacterium]
MNDRLDIVRLCHLSQALKVGDIAQLPDHCVSVRHDQIKALAILGDIEHHGRGPQFTELFDHPGTNAACRAGDEYGLAGEFAL